MGSSTTKLSNHDFDMIRKHSAISHATILKNILGTLPDVDSEEMQDQLTEIVEKLRKSRLQ